MNGVTHIVDLDGDVMIVLRNANATFAVSELPSPAITEEPNTDHFAGDGHGGAPEKKPIEEFSYDQNRVNHNDHQEDNIDDESRGKTFRIQVSAKHLMLASRVFKASLTDGGKENIAFCQQGSVEMTTEGWDLEAFLILLKIIHGQAHDPPQKLSLEMLAKVTVLPDFYGCQKPVRVLADMMWIRSIMDKADIPNEYTRDIKLWMWISWFFQLEALFTRTTAIAMNKSKGLITPSGLPIQ
ncbi:hypothetical protein BDV30DRAFT_250433 [Aspergillus minisclerotigenes]|uniref:BTB domain-containing protein n=1 Tax=Aspergillus minisclerotigenes TaxID=656917 RepID=A0A5N6IY47_9EURO|nr:hypothetical protein BDV30DRAFT_250433 [Aspergillus minisclerotigenes]